MRLDRDQSLCNPRAGVDLSQVRINCFTCQTRDRQKWCRLSEEDLAALDRVKISNVYKRGQVIFYQGNPCLGVYGIEEGTVALRKTDSEGNGIIVRIAHAGQTLGYRAHFSGESYTATAETLSDARIGFIDRAGVMELLERSPNLGLGFLRRLANDLKESEDHRLQTATLPVRARVAHLLLSLKERFATADDAGHITLDLPLSRQDLAAIIGTRPETIARTIKALENDGVAAFDGRRVFIADLDALLDEIEAQ